MRKRKKITVFIVLGILIASFLGLLLISPYGRALIRSKAHFVRHTTESSVFYEPGAENYADKIANFLPEAMRRVEKGHFLPFKKPFHIYVCSTQQSHNSFIGNPSEYPIRGASFLGNIYIAPSAFSFQGLDTHKEALTHELSHLHLRQRLGIIKLRKIPHWFVEGWANITAGSGGEGVSEDMAVRFIKEGKHLTIPEKGGLLTSLTKIIKAAGLSGPMFHRQNRMLVNYIKRSNPPAFRRLVLALQDGEDFDVSFRHHFNNDPLELWIRFKNGLEIGFDQLADHSTLEGAAELTMK